MTARELCEALRDDPTESHLAEIIDVTYYFLPVAPYGMTIDLAGCVLVPVDDGVLALSAFRIDADDGWEQFDLRSSRVFPKTPAVLEALDQYDSAMMRVAQLLDGTSQPVFEGEKRGGVP